MSELAIHQPAGGELARSNVNTEALMKIALEKGQDGALAVKELVQLQLQQQAREARQSFIEAFARVKDKVKTINASKPVPAKDGSVKWWVADLIDLQNEIEPILREEGMDLSFDTRRDGPNLNIVTGICIVTHTESGHEERRECGVNAGNAQGGDLGAATTAKRGALIAMFALRIKHDSNARMLGDLISPEQLMELQQRARAVGADEKKLLAYAGAPEWKSIRQGKLGQLHDFLRLKEKKHADGAGGMTGTFPAPASSAPSAPVADQPAPTEATHDQENAGIIADEFLDNALGGDENKIRSYVIGRPPQILARAKAISQIANPVKFLEWRTIARNAHMLMQQKK